MAREFLKECDLSEDGMRKAYNKITRHNNREKTMVLDERTNKKSKSL